MQQDLGWSRAFLTGSFTGALLVSAICTVVVGRWLDRHDGRPLLLAGAAGATALMVGWSTATERWVFVLVWLLVGACQATLFYEPAFAILVKRCAPRDLNRGITTVTLAAGLASTIFGPLTALLERSVGWRAAVLVLGSLLAVVTVPAFVFGLRGHASTHAADTTARTSSVREVVLGASFLTLTVAYLLSAITTFGVAVHLVPFLIGRGMTTGSAATVLGAVGLMQVLGRGSYLRLSATRTALHLATGVLAVRALGLAVLLVIPNTAGAALFALVYGAANGAATLTRASTVAELWGASSYGVLAGTIASVGAFGGALAPFGVSAAAAAVGSEVSVLWGLVAMAAVAAALNEVVARPTRRVPAVSE